jgi:hypothetical protein
VTNSPAGPNFFCVLLFFRSTFVQACVCSFVMDELEVSASSRAFHPRLCLSNHEFILVPKRCVCKQLKWMRASDHDGPLKQIKKTVLSL